MFRGAFRDGRMEDGDVYGEAVNIASRLEGLSPPEGVAVSEKVFVEIAERLELLSGTVRSHLHFARKALRKALQDVPGVPEILRKAQ